MAVVRFGDRGNSGLRHVQQEVDGVLCACEQVRRHDSVDGDRGCCGEPYGSRQVYHYEPRACSRAEGLPEIHSAVQGVGEYHALLVRSSGVRLRLNSAA